MSYDLPKFIDLDGEQFEIRYDFRVILEIFEAMNDPVLSDKERAFVVLQMFYLDFGSIKDYDEAIKGCFWFIRGGDDENTQQNSSSKIIDWEKDFRYIVSPINRVLGYDARSIEYDQSSNSGGLHWWTFLSAYAEIGECFFSQIVAIRDKKARGKPLDKSEREFYKKNQKAIDIKTQYSASENELLKMWAGK